MAHATCIHKRDKHPLRPKRSSLGASMIFVVLIAAAGAVMLLSGGLMGQKRSARPPAAKPLPVPLNGRFSGSPVGYVGRLILELQDDGTFFLRNIISIHLPPSELENLRGTVSWKGDTGCLLPEPKTIERCFQRTGPDELSLIQKQGHAQLRLLRIVDTAAGSKPTGPTGGP